MLLRCVAGLLFFVGPAYATIDTLLSGLSTKGHRREDPSFYYAQSLAM